jgi:cell division septal protein FtsQ
MQYQFEIVLSGGLGVTYGLVTPAWPVASTVIAGSIQKTNTMTIVLNGLEGVNWSLAALDGGATNNDAKDLPTINVSVRAPDLPDYVGRTRSRGHPEYPFLVLPVPKH